MAPGSPPDAPPTDSRDMDTDLALACPTCGATLEGSDAWETWRACPGCGRHFAIPARERLRLLLDDGVLDETDAVLLSIDPLKWGDRQHHASEERALDPAAEAVVTGSGRIGGAAAVVIALDHAYLGDELGPVAAGKIARAIDRAAARGLPVVAIAASGGLPGLSGAFGAWQAPKIAAAVGRLRHAGGLMVGVLAHPVTGAAWSALLAHADLLLAEPGAAIDLAPAPAGGRPRSAGVDALAAAGLVDAVIDRAHLRQHVGTLLATLADRGDFAAHAGLLAAIRPAARPGAAPPAPEGQPAWEQASVARHPQRPDALALLRRIVTDWTELSGDRMTGADPALVCGFGRLAGVPVAAMATRDRARPTAAGWRAAARLVRLAGRLGVPVIDLVQSPPEPSAADPVDHAAALAAAADLLAAAARTPSPLVAVMVGETGGGATVALAAADRVLALEHAVLVAGPRPGPPGLAAPGRPSGIGNLPARTAAECVRLGLADAVVPEPSPAAHADPDAAAALLADALAGALAELAAVGPRRLKADRARRYRGLGHASPEGREAARQEVRQWEDAQRALARSVADLREWWQGRAGLPVSVSVSVPNVSVPSVSVPRTLPSLPSREELAETIADRLARFRGEGG